MSKRIALTYLNIRQSISILLFKLILIDFLAAFSTIVFYFALIMGMQTINYPLSNPTLVMLLFTILGIIKISVSVYIVLLWLNEYYELTPYEIIHNRGIIFRKEEKYRLSNVRAMKFSDSFIGELCNFGTITLYDIRMQKYLDLYLIHNPLRYVHVLETLKPGIEETKEETILPGVKPKEE